MQRCLLRRRLRPLPLTFATSPTTITRKPASETLILTLFLPPLLSPSSSPPPREPPPPPPTPTVDAAAPPVQPRPPYRKPPAAASRSSSSSSPGPRVKTRNDARRLSSLSQDPSPLGSISCLRTPILAVATSLPGSETGRMV